VEGPIHLQASKVVARSLVSAAALVSTPPPPSFKRPSTTIPVNHQKCPIPLLHARALFRSPYSHPAGSSARARFVATAQFCLANTVTLGGESTPTHSRRQRFLCSNATSAYLLYNTTPLHSFIPPNRFAPRPRHFLAFPFPSNSQLREDPLGPVSW
jgi:hypothetical protein